VRVDHAAPGGGGGRAAESDGAEQPPVQAGARLRGAQRCLVEAGDLHVQEAVDRAVLLVDHLDVLQRVQVLVPALGEVDVHRRVLR
jgi:hypothetical protein